VLRKLDGSKRNELRCQFTILQEEEFPRINRLQVNHRSMPIKGVDCDVCLRPLRSSQLVEEGGQRKAVLSCRVTVVNRTS